MAAGQEPMTTAAPGLGRYEIDPGGSTVTFRTRHVFGLLPVTGTLALDGGTVDIAEPLGASRVHATLTAAGFSTGNAVRDRTVRSARFLDAARYPLITFAAERLDGTALVGALTVRGVTRPVTLLIEESATTVGTLRVRATARLDRTEFGVTASRGMTGRHLDVVVQVTCVRS